MRTSKSSHLREHMEGRNERTAVQSMRKGRPVRSNSLTHDEVVALKNQLLIAREAVEALGVHK